MRESCCRDIYNASIALLDCTGTHGGVVENNLGQYLVSFWYIHIVDCQKKTNENGKWVFRRHDLVSLTLSCITNHVV